MNELNKVVEDNTIIEHIGSMIYTLGYEKKIINDLHWNDDEHGDGWLTLKEIAEQLNQPMRVVMDGPLYGHIYEFGNYNDGKWYIYALTKGYA